MKYSKEGKGWGQGDSVWACDSKFGNCTDFHSLFISLARGNKIPAKFEMGFPIPPKRGEGADRRLPLLGLVHARGQGLGAGRHLRGQPVPGDDATTTSAT